MSAPVAAVEEALDALESMVCQYLHYPSQDVYDREFYHSFMSAGEEACAVLANLRPLRWRITEAGCRFVGEWDHER